MTCMLSVKKTVTGYILSWESFMKNELYPRYFQTSKPNYKICTIFFEFLLFVINRNHGCNQH